MKFSKRFSCLSVCLLLLLPYMQSQAALTSSGRGPASETNWIAAVTYDNPLKADSIDSDKDNNLKNDFWRFTAEELDLGNDGVFNDLVFSGWHKGILQGEIFNPNLLGPKLQLIFLDVEVGKKYDTKAEIKMHGADQDSISVDFLIIPGNKIAEIGINLSHVPTPVPEVPVYLLLLAGLVCIATLHRKTEA